MDTNDGVNDKTAETASESQGAGKPNVFENCKNSIADKLDDFAEALGEKTADQETKSGIAQYGKQASELLGQSAKHLRQFDHEQTDAMIREYVGQHPERSLLIAGGIGLIIGAILHRR